jgi:hypothetical protein
MAARGTDDSRRVPLLDSLPARSLTARVDANGVHAHRPPLSPARMIEQSGLPRNTRELAALEHQLLESTTGTKITDLGASMTTAAAPDGVVRAAMPMADLDGDVLPDVVIQSVTLAEGEWSLDGYKGSTGDHLWSRSFGTPFDIFVLQPGDLDGDGHPDLVVVTGTDGVSSDEGVCTTPPIARTCLLEFVSNVDWTVTGIRGADGSTLWANTYNGTVTDDFVAAETPVAGATGHLERVRDLLVSVALGGDATGDGRADAIITVVGGTFTDASTGSAVGGVELAASSWDITGQVLDGQNGNAILTMSETNTATPRLYLAAGRAQGGATTRVAKVTFAGSQTNFLPLNVQESDEIQLLDAVGEPVWTATVDGSLRQLQPISDRTDGTDDLLLDVNDGASGAVAVLDGPTGAAAWTRSLTAADLGDLGALPVKAVDGTTDLLLFTLPFSSTSADLTTRRLDGRTGTEYLNTTRSMPVPDGGFVDVGVSILGDVDHDGANDVAVDLSSVVFNPDVAPTTTTDVTTESGATGVIVCSSSGPGFSVGVPAGDLDGDGFDDVVVFTMPDSTFDVIETAVSSSTCGSLWTITHSFAGYDTRSTIEVVPAGDTTGAGHGDLLDERVGLDFADNTAGSQVDLRDGLTGTAAWSVGSF